VRIFWKKGKKKEEEQFWSVIRRLREKKMRKRNKRE